MPSTTQSEKKTESTSSSAAPQISLPKGGGAIRGIGEKFSTNAMMGTGSLGVPIAVSPGRSGFGPQLSVTYDSGAGNGIFGVGWGLSTPSISRKTDKGLPQYRDLEDSDVFLLSGAEDLVPVLKKNGHDQWEKESTERQGYRIQFYRPRVEGLFARIERWTRKEDGDVHWRSFTKDNLLTIYGSGPESRISDPERPLHIFKWLIAASYDAKGNAIHYEYKAENTQGVGLARPSERRRQQTANRHLKRILYGNRTPFDSARGESEDPEWMFELVFDYGEEDIREEPGGIHVRLGEHAREAGWLARRDPFSSYRSGFEIRTHRLCRRTLMLHHFPDELGVPAYLVRTTEFEYDEKEIGSFLKAVIQSGYTRADDGSHLKQSLPRLDLGYTASPLEAASPGAFELKEADARNLPEGIDGASYRWIDLFGEGISGVLAEQGSGWYYKSNLGEGRLGASTLVSRKPSSSRLTGGHQQLMDIGGEGDVDLVEFASGSAGFYEGRHTESPAGDTEENRWRGFRPFRAWPVLDWSDPNLRFVDLTGDGISDILVTEDVALRWHPSLQSEGFSAAVRIPAPMNENEGPKVVFSDPMQSIYLADMSGDGLTDIVRIRNGEVCYWPNLGYGHFGPKIVMDSSPWFDSPGLFDHRQIRVADTDGSGTTDIFYLATNEIHVYLNQSGNSLSARRILKGLPVGEPNAISVADFLGLGTACLIWSSPLPANALRPLRYVDLMRGAKPHLLNRIINNLGAETRIEYASSTEFYLADKAAGHPWVTRLPFPVHVVKSVETFDYVSRNRFIATSSYHHGYYDGVEREFRGFGRVDQIDTEEFDVAARERTFPDAGNQALAWRVPPIRTNTWYHTGVFVGADRVSRHLAHEYYQEPGQDQNALLDDTLLPPGLTPEEAREACRALKGSVLRQEVYALDGSANSRRPYTAVESNATIRILQPRGGNLHCVFFAHSRESRAFNYERKLYDVCGKRRADPRVSHALTLAVDDYGNVLKSASVGYGRRFPDPSLLLSEADHGKQGLALITLTENRYTNAVRQPNAYRTPALAESRGYEVVHLETHARFFQFEEFSRHIAQAKDLPFEDVNASGATGPGPYRRSIQESRTRYRNDALDRLLAVGELESLALPGENYSLSLTPGLIAEVYGEKLPAPHEVLHNEGGYIDLDGNGRWWAPSGRVYFSPEPADGPAAELAYARRHFYLPQRFQDPFANVSIAVYDPHDLAVVETRDPLGNVVRAQLDYRVLQLHRTVDVNGNRSEVVFDALGMLTGTAIMGKESEQVGDSLEGFVADLPQHVVLEHLRDPLRDPQEILGSATTRMVYDLFAYDRTRNESQPQPSVTYTLARENHVSDLPAGVATKIQHALSYSDGLGREVQKKMQAERLPDGIPRWIGSGWTIFNNKGKPVRQYEPFFSSTHHFEFAVTVGVTSTLIYDPVARVVAKLNANHSFEKTVFDPWRQESWDSNDTVLIDPRQDPDVGAFLRNMPVGEFLPTWYEQRRGGDLGATEQEAAWKTASHANTPSVTFADSLGRTFLSVAHNRIPGEGHPPDEFYLTRSELDIRGNQQAVTDALGRVIMTYDYDVAGKKIHQNSADGGERWMINDIAQSPLLAFNSRDFRLRREYDALRRPTTLFVRNGGGQEKLAERTEYGESHPWPAVHNLRGKVYRQFDAAGLGTIGSYDFKGNPLLRSRQMLVNYKGEVDWTATADLESDVFQSETSYDALNRPVTVTAPDRSVARPTYNEANLLEQLHVQLKNATESSPFVTIIDYNAKGQRELIEYGNGARTVSLYDPLTFRLVHLKTTRVEDGMDLQDLGYAYDPAGNISSIADAAQQTVYFKNQVVSASGDYVYDAIYRLWKATGREHTGNPDEPETSYSDIPRVRLPLPGDGHAMRNYREQYRYDPVGNFLEVLHAAGADGNWRRHYEYGQIGSNNRLTKTSVGQSEESYSYDPDGNITRMGHLPRMEWNFKDQLISTQTQVVNGGQAETTYYVYDSSGARVRKVTDGTTGHRRADRMYVGGFEMYREYAGGSVELERTTLHVMDDKRRVALVETRSASTTVRYQFDNHLGSACLELDDTASVITYEEYYPYGSTSFQAGRSVAEVSLKRYRFTGMERDEETGFSSHGARYYAPWLARWTSADPIDVEAGVNLYSYVNGNPISRRDPNGTDDTCGVYDEDNLVCRQASCGEIDNAIQQQSVWSIGSGTPAGPASTQSGTQAVGSTFNLGGAGLGLQYAAPEGFTLLVPNSYDGVKMYAYRKGVLSAEIGKNAGPGASTNARRVSQPQVDARDDFGDLFPEPTDPAPGGRGWAKDHIIELQHDLTGTKGESWGDYRWQDSALNSLEGSQSWQLQRNNPLGEPAGGVARLSEGTRWYNTEGYRSTVSGIGEGFFWLGVIQTADHMTSAISADIDQGTGGVQTAKAAAEETGGWTAACYGGELGVEAGLFCGEGAPVCSPVFGLVGGAVGYTGGTKAVDAIIDEIPTQKKLEEGAGWLDWNIRNLYGIPSF